MTNYNKINLFGIEIDPLTRQEAVKCIASWVQASEYNHHYVVTPNVDHLVLLNENSSFKDAYKSASLVVADGKPVVWASKLLGKPLPEVVTGSDLTPAIFEYFQIKLNKSLKIFILGAMPGIAEKAATNIQSTWPNVKVVGLFSPGYGFEKSNEISQHICDLINQVRPDIVVFGVGAPKQELWAKAYSAQLNTKVILCVGATIDFLAGTKARAPIWVQKIGMEWLHRLLGEPKRLFARYFKDAYIFPILIYKAWKNNA